MDYTKKPHRNSPVIRSLTVRLIDEDGQSLGIVSVKEAQLLAQQRGLDLVEVSPDANPPVCKIADYGRLCYAEQKKKNEMKKKQKIMVLKEIQIRPNIQEHDYKVKFNHVSSFLQQRDKVKLILQFRGREVAFAEQGKKIMERMIAELTHIGKVEFSPKMEGRRMIAIIAPLKQVDLPLETKDSPPSSPLTVDAAAAGQASTD